VHIISATKDHQEEAKENVEKATSTDINAKNLIHTHAVDMGSLNELIPMAQNLASSLKRLDLLHLNAGVGVAPFGLTTDGLGNHYAINYLAHLVLADIFSGKMKETAKEKQGSSEVEKFSTRIVVQSSELHRTSPSDVKCESLEEMNEDVGAAQLYGRSKLFE
jgi:NAD(P)-dependent dehydrogenase (short-subunit alcohol dehydrogenase family)